MTLLHTHIAIASYKIGQRYCLEAFKIDLPKKCLTPYNNAIAIIKKQLSAKPMAPRFDMLRELFEILPNGQTKKL